MTIGSFHIANSTFSNNTAIISGGVIASYGSFYFANCVFSKNVAMFVLGGTFAASNGSYYIDGCSFEGSRAGSVGGAIVANNGSFVILNSNFRDNVAQANGGDILVSQCSFLIVNCTFSSSTLSLNFFNSNVTFDGYVSFKNDEIVGGISHVIGHIPVPIDNQGGAIMVTSFHSQLHFTGQIYLENSLATYGGVISATSSVLQVYGKMIFTHNAAVNNGGAIYLDGATLEIFGSCNVSQNRHCGVCWPALLLVLRAFHIIVFASTLSDPGVNLFVIIANTFLLVILNRWLWVEFTKAIIFSLC